MMSRSKQYCLQLHTLWYHMMISVMYVTHISDTYRQYQRLKTGGKKTQTESTADASGVKPNDGADSVVSIAALLTGSL